MQSSKTLQSRISLYLKAFALALLILFSSMPIARAANSDGSVKVTTPKTYRECVDNYKNSSLNNLNDRIQKASKTKTDQLAKLTKQVESANISDAQKAKLTAGMAKDTEVINAIADSSRKNTDVQQVKTNYCAIIFKTRVNSYRAKQVKYVAALGQYLKSSGSFNAKLQNDHNKNNKGLLKAEVNQRTNQARKLMASSLIGANMYVDSVVNASVDADGVPNLQRPNFAILKSNYQDAYRAYTESWILKKAAGATKVQKDANVTLVSVDLLDEKGNPATDKLRSVTKAKVVLNVDGKQKTYNLERKNTSSVWVIAKD